VSIICLKNEKVVGTIGVEQTPSYLLFDDKSLFVTSYAGNVVLEFGF
jgi:hypothetical protein